MRVLIDATYARRAPRSGTGVYIARLLGALARLPDAEPIALVNPRRRPPAGGGAGSVRNLAADHWWSAVALPALARRHRAEVIHHPLPMLAPLSPVPQLVTVHDLAFERLPELFAPAFRRYAHLAHRAAARGAAVVICPSQATASDLAELWGVARERIIVAPLGPGQADAAAVSARLGQTDAGAVSARTPAGSEGYFLYVGDGEPRKNLGVLLAAYARYRERATRPLELVLAGRPGPLAPAAGVRMVADPDPPALLELYRGALAVVHPALHEGFGLTPLEAMALGTPVLAARSPGITEVCADAVRYAEARDPEDFARGMTALAGEAAQRAQLAELGLRRAARYDWAWCARAHRDAYSLALR
jgi:glycosyltransferase involved in cell wall biosynthesis